MDIVLYLCYDKETGVLLYSGLDEDAAEDINASNKYQTLTFCFSLDYYHSRERLEDKDLKELLDDAGIDNLIRESILDELKHNIDEQQYRQTTDAPI